MRREKYYLIYQKFLDVFLFFLLFSLQVGRVNLKAWGIPLSWGRSLDNLVVAFYLLWFLGMVVFRRQQARRSCWDIPIWSLIIFLGFSTWQTINYFHAFPARYASPVQDISRNSWDNYRAMLTGWLIFLAVISRLSSRRNLSILKKVIVLALVCVCLTGLIRYLSGIYHPDAQHRFSTATLHPNGLGVYLTMISPLVILGFAQSRKRGEKIGWGGLLLFLLVALAFTFSRTSWVAFFVALFYLLLRARRRRVSYVVLSIVILTVALGFSHPRLRQRIFTLQSWPRDENLERRLTYIRAALNMVEDSPLWGVGYGSLAFRNTYLMYYKEKETGEQVQDPHNLYLNFAATAGLPALLFFLWLVGRVLRTSFRNPRTEDQELFAWRLTFQAGFLSFLFIGLAESPFYSYHLLSFFWFFLALGAIVNGQVKSSSIRVLNPNN